QIVDQRSWPIDAGTIAADGSVAAQERPPAGACSVVVVRLPSRQSLGDLPGALPCLQLQSGNDDGTIAGTMGLPGQAACLPFSAGLDSVTALPLPAGDACGQAAGIDDGGRVLVVSGTGSALDNLTLVSPGGGTTPIARTVDGFGSVAMTPGGMA